MTPIIYIVTWAVTSMGTCDQYPKPDAYGRLPDTNLAVACFNKYPHSKEFKSKEEAEAFFNDGVKQPDLSDFKISTRVEEGKP